MNKLSKFSVMAIGIAISSGIVATPAFALPARSDIIGMRPDGTLLMYTNTGSASPFSSGSTQVGNGWSTFDRVVAGDTALGDGLTDLNGISAWRETSVYSNSGSNAPFSSPTLQFNYNSFWNSPSGLQSSIDMDGSKTDKFMLFGDLTGDRRADLLTVDKNGDLWAAKTRFVDWCTFAANCSIVNAQTKIGNGWNTFRLLTLGDFNGDGYDDLIGVKASDNSMWLYPNNRSYDGAIFSSAPTAETQTVSSGYPFSSSTARQIGSGWSAFDTILAGDMNNDGKSDIVGRTSSGDLYVYYNVGSSNAPLSVSAKIGTGWGGFSTLLLGEFRK